MNLKTNSTIRNFDLWLGKPAPRYTSYPPAPFFSANVDESHYIKSLKGLSEKGPVSLYIHIPFCRSLCLYCGCNAKATHRQDRISAYLSSLERETEMLAALTGRLRIDSLHFGGGTPNLLGQQELRDLFASLGRHFDLGSAHEIAMELDPREVTPDQAKILADCGVTRVSLGAQDFDPQVQDIIHRRQPFEQVASVCNLMRQNGIAHINLDLMYGLPKQTPETVAETARLACTLAPSRVVLFSYAHVPRIKKHQHALEAYGLPTVHDRLNLDRSARDVLIGSGYHAIGIDHFATEGDTLTTALREGRLHRNFQGYTDTTTASLIGLGCSSISQTADGYFQSEHDERAYQSLVARGALPVKRGFLLSFEDRFRHDIIERLMCDLSCDVETLCQKHQFPIEKLADDFERLRPYIDAGLISRQGFVLKLTTPHRMAIRVICKAFDTYSLATQQAVSSQTA